MASVGNLTVNVNTTELVALIDEHIKRCESLMAQPAQTSAASVLVASAVAAGSTKRITRRSLLFPLRKQP